VQPGPGKFRQSVEYSVTANKAVLDVVSRNREHFLFNIWKMGNDRIAQGNRDSWTVWPKRIAATEARTIMTFELLGLKSKYVWGMNRGPVRLAFERKELNINYDSMPGYLRNATQLVKAGKAVPLYSMGIVDDKGALVRDPNAPDLPHFGEAYETMFGKKPSGPGYDAWQSVNKMMTMLNKGLFLPAGTPKPVVDAWRTAITNILKDPDFDKDAGKIIEGYPQFIGDAATPIVKDATNFKPEAWAWLKTYFKSQHNVTIE
jgi:hypothetical protein